MTLKEKEGKVEVHIGKPSPGCVSLSLKSDRIAEVGRESKTQLQRITVQLNRINSCILRAPNTRYKTHQSYSCK